MKSAILVTIASATFMLAVHAGVALAGHEGHGGPSGALVHAAAPHPMAIAGRIIAVRRISQEISVQTPTGQVREVKVPNTATISSKGGNHFNAVRAGQNVHLMAVRDPSQGLVAHSVSIP